MPRPDPVKTYGEVYSTSLMLVKEQVQDQIKRSLKTTTDLIYRIGPSIENDERRLEKIRDESKLMGARMKDCRDFLDELQDLNANKVDHLIELANRLDTLTNSTKKE